MEVLFNWQQHTEIFKTEIKVEADEQLLILLRYEPYSSEIDLVSSAKCETILKHHRMRQKSMEWKIYWLFVPKLIREKDGP